MDTNKTPDLTDWEWRVVEDALVRARQYEIAAKIRDRNKLDTQANAQRDEGDLRYVTNDAGIRVLA